MQASNFNYESFTNSQEGTIGYIETNGGVWCVMKVIGKTYDSRDALKVKSEHKSKQDAESAALDGESVCEIFKMIKN